MSEDVTKGQKSSSNCDENVKKTRKNAVYAHEPIPNGMVNETADITQALTKKRMK